MTDIEQIRQVRLAIARKRAADMARRYPEIDVSVIEPLNDEGVIAVALARELAHQQQVLRDIEGGKP